MKLPKHLAKLHREALALVRSGRTLTSDERSFVLEHYHEGAEHMNGLSGAFFTPLGLARDFAIEVPERHRILDLCAGIGALAYACEHKCDEIVCVERNQQYLEVGKVVVPSATWVCADVFDVEAYRHHGPFERSCKPGGGTLGRCARRSGRDRSPDSPGWRPASSHAQSVHFCRGIQSAR